MTSHAQTESLPPRNPSHDRAFTAMTVLFFAWGFITWLNDLLIPKFKADFALSQFQANLVQSAFFGAYFMVALGYFVLSALRGDPINRMGYKNGVVLGLIISSTGCALFYPAAEWHLYPLFLTALLILGGGVTLIQIAANPYIAILGNEGSASARLNLSQGVNSLGYVIAPLVGGLLLFGSDLYRSEGSAGIGAVKLPYVGLACGFAALAVFFKTLKLPEFRNPDKVERGIHVFRYPHFLWGWLAIFFYVGSEVTIGSILINFLGSEDVLNLPANLADKYLSFYWGGLMIGRLMGAVSLSRMNERKKGWIMALVALLAVAVIYLNVAVKEKMTLGMALPFASVTPFLWIVAVGFLMFLIGKTSPGKTVGLFAAVAILMVGTAMKSHGHVALWSLVGVGLFNSIMWSNIFTLAIRGLGNHRSQGSSLLVMMVVGGAVMPAIQGALMDVFGVRLSLTIVLVGYLYLLIFGFYGSRRRSLVSASGEVSTKPN